MSSSILGAEIPLSTEQLSDLTLYLQNSLHIDFMTITSYKAFSRARINHRVYHSTSYGRATKQNSYTVLFTGDNGSTLFCGQIKYFVSCATVSHISKIICAIDQFDEELSLLSKTTYAAMDDHLKNIFHSFPEASFHRIFITAEQIVSPCIRINLTGNEFILATFPNKLDFIN